MRVTLRSWSVFALIGTAAAVPAFAQSSGPSSPPLVTYAACASKPSQADTEAAHGAYMAGKGSFDEADYTTAVNYFRDAYRRDCTKHELLVIIARAYELQGNRREAIHALETYLERVPTASDAEVQKRHIANLKREITDQQASAAASASAAPPASAAPIPSASAAPSASVLATTPVPTASASEPAAPMNAPPASGGHTIYPWLLVGGGVVAAAIGGVMFGIGTSNVSQAETVCGSNHVCPGPSSGTGQNPAVSQGNSGRTDETIGVALGSVGLAALVGGVLWHFVERPSHAAPTTGKVELTPSVAPGYVGVQGRF
ncbi:MAG TPA: tetratricopeptide repeat protein [Polyangiaceae bacterium]